MNDQELLRYSRHLLLDEFDIDNQYQLLQSKVLIVGAGGLGSPVALYLAAAGIGHLYIADHDHVDLSNLQRQIIHQQASIGHNKALSAQSRLRALNPDITVYPITYYLSQDELTHLVKEIDLVIDCSDNFTTRYALNKTCRTLNTPLISGAAIKFHGLVCTFNYKHHPSPCYHCLFPEHIEAEELRCATTGVFSPLVGMIGSIQAAEAIKVLTGLGVSLQNRLLRVNALTMKFSEARIIPDPDCPICQTQS